MIIFLWRGVRGLSTVLCNIMVLEYNHSLTMCCLLVSITVTVRNQQIQQRSVRARYHRPNAIGLHRKYRFAFDHQRCFARKGCRRVNIITYYMHIVSV